MIQLKERAKCLLLCFKEAVQSYTFKAIVRGNRLDTLKKEDFLLQLLSAHEAYYDVERNYQFANQIFPGYAEFHTHGEKYVISKRAKIWEADAHEYMFFLTADRVDSAFLQQWITFVTTQGLQKASPKPNHMTSYLSLVIVADQVEDFALSLIRRARFRKNFLFGIHGWADLRLIVIDLQKMQIYTNGQGKEIKELFQANLSLAAKKM